MAHQVYKNSSKKMYKHALCALLYLMAAMPLRAQEFVLPSNSFNIGFAAHITNFTIREAAPEKYIGFAPGVSLAFHTNLNKQFMHSFYGMAGLSFAADVYERRMHGMDYELGYKVSTLKSPVVLVTGISFKEQIYSPQQIGLWNEFYLSQLTIPFEVYYTKLLPSKDAILLQVATPLLALVAATDLPEPPDWLPVLPYIETTSFFDRDYTINLPIKDYSGIRFVAAYVNTLSKTSALKIAYVFRYYQLNEPENINVENGLALQLQF
jgi:hypothetical protein